MTKKKEEKKFDPQIIEKVIEMPKVDLEKLNKDIDINTILDTDKEDIDSFYKAVVTQLYNDKDIETKSYNQGVVESFHLAKLSYLGIRCNIPAIREFVEKLERKRVSIERKGRTELIRALIERQQEMERERAMQQAELLKH